MDFQLSEKATAEIDAKLPDLKKIQHCLLFNPTMIASKAGPESNLDVAATCFTDAYKMLADAHYALDRSYISLVWFREEAPVSPDEMSAIYRAKYYADDVALRLYASGEYCADFIVTYLAIPEAEITKFKEQLKTTKKKITVTSSQAIVGKYVMEKYPGHKITEAIKKVIGEPNWKRTRDYRDKWVHNQTPLIHGLGMQYERKSRWTKYGEDYDLAIEFGDEPSLTIEELQERITKAFNAYAICLSDLFDMLLDDIEALGIKIDFENSQVTYL